MRSPTCLVADWIESFKKTGWSKCGKDNLFITGFHRLNSSDNTKDPISLLEQARCCSSTPEFRGQDSTCTIADWWYSLDRYVFNTRRSLYEYPRVICGLHNCMLCFQMSTKFILQSVSKREAFQNSPIKTHFQIDIFLACLSEF